MTGINEASKYRSEDEQLNRGVRDHIANIHFDIETPLKLIKKGFKRFGQKSKDLLSTLTSRAKKDKK